MGLKRKKSSQCLHCPQTMHSREGRTSSSFIDFNNQILALVTTPRLEDGPIRFRCISQAVAKMEDAVHIFQHPHKSAFCLLWLQRLHILNELSLS